jgi:hypothetical protein
MPCNVFIPGTQAPACNAVPVGGICRVSSAGSVCAGTIGGTCGDLATYYLKITP